MRTSAILRALPILPPRSLFPTYFYTKCFGVVVSSGIAPGNVKGKQARTGVADETLATQLVDSFGIKDGSTVLEGYPGLGYLTRSMLRSTKPHIPKIIALEPSLGLAERALGFPLAVHGGYPISLTARTPTAEDSTPGPVKGVPGAVRFPRGDGNRVTMVLYEVGPNQPGSASSPAEVPSDMTRSDPTISSHNKRVHVGALPSDPTGLGDGRLIIGDEAIFHWGTFQTLRDNGYLGRVEKRNWDDDEPPDLHFVCQVPDAELGEQMVNQWIGCIASKSWMFEYGRVKMSLIVSATLYDRLIAPISSKAYTKMTVMRRALCDVIPSSPGYPSSAMLELSGSQRKVKKIRAGPGAKGGLGGNKPGWADTIVEGIDTVDDTETKLPTQRTWEDDAILSPSEHLVYPPTILSSRRKLSDGTGIASTAGRPARPVVFGLTLIPKKRSPIDGKNKDAWDYVLRRMFVLSSQRLEVAIANLGPGAKNLVPLLTDGTVPSQLRVSPHKVVRDYTVEDWGNIVRVFQEWKFAPDLLMVSPTLESKRADSYSVRSAGSGM